MNETTGVRISLLFLPTETSQVSYLLFEAATLLRVGVIREWRDLSKEDSLQLRQYIVHYVVNRRNIPHYVRETLVQVCVEGAWLKGA